MEVEWIKEISPLLIFIISWILVYTALKKLKIPASDWVLSILSIAFSLFILISERATNFLSKAVSMSLTVIITSFLLITLLAFIAKDISIFMKPLSWIFAVIAAAMLIFLAFEFFPEIYHMMPGTSNSFLTASTRQFKSFIYSKEFLHNFWLVVSIGVFGFILVKK